MYVIAVSFEVPPERHQDFIDAVLEDGRDSAANEPGTLRFELVQDPEHADRFYLNEAYTDETAFVAHCEGPYFKRFFDIIGGFARGPVWIIKGSRIEDPVQRPPASRADRGAPIADSLTVIARFLAAPGRGDEVREAPRRDDRAVTRRARLPRLPALHRRRQSRPGHSRRALDDHDALHKHFATPHFGQVTARLAQLLAAPFTVEELRPYAGDRPVAAVQRFVAT